MKAVQTFRCIGGPLDGLEATEQYAGSDYHRFNSADGELWPHFRFNQHSVSYKTARRKALDVRIAPYCPKCVLLYFPKPSEVVIE